ncbi:MAG: saccharopine dehydrogenase C-terminal domain-containing protein [Fimbriimonadaceae bacterium]
MDTRYAILGSGMQGTACAYDIARFGEPAQLTLADADPGRARAAADRVNNLLNRHVCGWAAIDAEATVAVAEFLTDYDVAVSALPYRLHLAVERAALRARCSIVDMGNDTDVSIQALELHGAAQTQGMTIVTDCGLAPGLVNSIGTMLVGEFDRPASVRLFCGGLPENPKPPLNYALRFSIEGLVGEYIDESIVLRGGKVARVEPLSELEQLEFPGFGTLEAFATSSGSGTAPYTLRGRLADYEYKTLRYPGHCELMRMFRNHGFWHDGPVEVGESRLRPIDLFHRLVEERLIDPHSQDVVLVLALARGWVGDTAREFRIEMVDRFDPATGFGAMERMTGFSTAIQAIAVGRGEVPRGAYPCELALPGDRVLEELARRGIGARRSSRPLSPHEADALPSVDSVGATR